MTLPRDFSGGQKLRFAFLDFAIIPSEEGGRLWSSCFCRPKCCSRVAEGQTSGDVVLCRMGKSWRVAGELGLKRGLTRRDAVSRLARPALAPARTHTLPTSTRYPRWLPDPDSLPSTLIPKTKSIHNTKSLPTCLLRPPPQRAPVARPPPRPLQPCAPRNPRWSSPRVVK